MPAAALTPPLSTPATIQATENKVAWTVVGVSAVILGIYMILNRKNR